MICVVATTRHCACLVFVPDPRWMALHKLWLARKRPKDQRQGEVLLDVTRWLLVNTHPLDIDFVLSLPVVFRGLFDERARSRRFVPSGL